MKIFFCTLLFACLLLAACGTKTVYVPVESTHTETQYVDRWQRDSIHLHDSVFVMMRGDTVWLQKYKTLYRERLVRDSIFVTDSVRISVPYPVVEVKEVNRLSTWQIILMCLGGVLVGYVGYRVVRIFR